MSNHFHWLLSTPESNLGAAMRYFMTETSRAIARSTSRINHVYGGRYKPCLLSTPAYYANTFRYIYQNPLRAGICKNVLEYPWSTLVQPEAMPLVGRPEMENLLPSERGELIIWLNKLPPKEVNEWIRKAMRRAEFKFAPHPKKKISLSGLEFL